MDQIFICDVLPNFAAAHLLMVRWQKWKAPTSSCWIRLPVWKQQVEMTEAEQSSKPEQDFSRLSVPRPAAEAKQESALTVSTSEYDGGRTNLILELSAQVSSQADKISELEAKLAEKDRVIRELQKLNSSRAEFRKECSFDSLAEDSSEATTHVPSARFSSATSRDSGIADFHRGPNIEKEDRDRRLKKGSQSTPCKKHHSRSNSQPVFGSQIRSLVSALHNRKSALPEGNTEVGRKC
ncbi:hypothetical protein Bbelb_390350 [Branchiostoma belcheri]|nr:hypothetical protein Bbelb_390350 [Branchiostoma belcheri]